jgi:hypothetical protein
VDASGSEQAQKARFPGAALLAFVDHGRDGSGRAGRRSAAARECGQQHRTHHIEVARLALAQLRNKHRRGCSY